MPGLLDFLSEKIGLLNRVGPLGSITPTNLREYGLQRALTALNDQAQGASRGISADLLGGPVDMVSQLMTVPRYLGAPTPDFTRSPVGGSQWIGQKLESMGLLRPQTGSVDETAGRVIGGLLSTPQVVGAVGGAVESGLLQAARNAAIPNRMNPQTGAIVWHGSPHKFDRFDSSKIGTGEGAQAYGHGLYLADAKTVAKSYAPGMNTVTDGQSPLVQNAAQYIDAYGGTNKTFAEWLKDVRQFSSSKASDNELRAIFNQAKQLSRGNLYKVDLPDPAIARMLDWDKPLSQQAPEVQNAIKSVAPAYSNEMIAEISKKIDASSLLARTTKDPSVRKAAIKEHGRLVNSLRLRDNNIEGKSLVSYLGEPVKASERLAAAGIPGIRYLDGGSRGAGQGTSNYVVFPGNEGLLKILERNGQPVK